jgi:hypothetical protein
MKFGLKDASIWTFLTACTLFFYGCDSSSNAPMVSPQPTLAPSAAESSGPPPMIAPSPAPPQSSATESPRPESSR